MNSRGLFITIEGVEGVGKSTNLAYLERQLAGQGVDLVVTREPGGSLLGEDVRQLLLTVRDESISPMAELLLIFAARAQHIAGCIEPALAAGKWVLCDRFTDASYAYQGGGRGLGKSVIHELEILVQGELQPDCTLLLDAPVSIGMERARGRGELDRFEREEVEFFQRARASYLELAEQSSGRFRVIDASASLDEVQHQLLKICSELMTCWGVRQTGS